MTHKELQTGLKYICVGTLSSLVELLAYALFQSTLFAPFNTQPTGHWFFVFLGIDYLGYALSYFVSIVIGYGLAFVFNRKFTFHTNTSVTASLLLYTLMVLFTIVAHTWLGGYLSTQLVSYGHMTPLVDMVLKIALMILPVLWTYPLCRFVIHKQ